MVMCSSTWIEMDLVVIKKLNKIKLCDFVVYDGYTIKLKYEHQIYDALTQNYDFYYKTNKIYIH
jgi:hypothetical protein